VAVRGGLQGVSQCVRGLRVIRAELRHAGAERFLYYPLVGGPELGIARLIQFSPVDDVEQ
jgi:hypothetical protein